MPKIRTRRSAAKRFKLTSKGKIKREKANANHIFTKKSPKRHEFHFAFFSNFTIFSNFPDLFRPDTAREFGTKCSKKKS